MKLNKLFACSLIALAGALPAIGQTTDSDNINVTAVFKTVIDLNVTSGANITFTVQTLDQYTNGLSDPTAYQSTFDVSSSVNFQVSLSATNFTDANGNTLNANNFGYTLTDAGTYTAGTNHLLLGGSASPSPMALLGTTSTIVAATGSGNAGPASANAYDIDFELGTANVRALSGLPTLLAQNIAPSTYTSVVTLTASAMP
ncbi:MAG: hypothetical protein SF053_17150 [Bacteroidia bacterium]|nr:hypothetical protein [Bacteroidia bacterium]